MALLKKHWFLSLGVALTSMAKPAGAEEFQRLSDAEIGRLITGEMVTDGVHHTDRFKAGGAMRAPS